MEAMKGETMIGIANAPRSWGSLEFELEGESPDYGQVLNEIVETGYAGTELGDRGFMPTDPEKLSEEIWAKSQTARRIRAGISQRSGF
jgi:inosose dehydratase